ncbi:MAG: Ig-like domain-containing protein [Lachnospiraceae bacterium]|nr:Ig-like domain-containing protein [Lachnospiraceae bacterium]
MKALKRSLLFFVMACTLVLGVPGNVYAATIVASGSLGSGGTYELDSNQLLIISGTDTGTYTGGMNARSVVGRDFKAVKINKGVTRVSDYTFMSTRLGSVSLPVGLEQIGHESFIGTGLKNITLPKTVTFVNERAFDWGGLERVYFNGTQDEFEKVETVHNGSRMSLYTFIKTNYPSIRTGVIAGKTAPKGNTIKLKSIKLNMKKATMSLNQQISLWLESFTPSDATDLTLEWTTSNPLVAIVSANGVVTCVGPGNAKITAMTTDGSKKKATVNITGPKQVSSVKITGDKTIEYHGTAQLYATVKPDNAVNTSITWTIDKGNGEVDSNGLVTCTGAGDIKVRATSANGKKTTFTIKGPKAASSVKITGPKSIEYQGTAQLSATVKPDNAIDKTVTWSIDKGNGEVDANGLVTCTGAGDIRVRATAATGKKSTYTLKGPKEAASVKITGEKNITLNGTVQLTATVKPDNAIDKTVTWEVEKGNGTVDVNGLVTCTGAGDIKVKATAVTGKKGTFTIRGPKAATSVSVKKSSYKLAVGETVQPVATVNPKGVIDPNVTWSSSDPAIATVSPDGTITAVAPGKVTIFATAHNGKVGKCTVTVQ